VYRIQSGVSTTEAQRKAAPIQTATQKLESEKQKVKIRVETGQPSHHSQNSTDSEQEVNPFQFQSRQYVSNSILHKKPKQVIDFQKLILENIDSNQYSFINSPLADSPPHAFSRKQNTFESTQTQENNLQEFVLPQLNQVRLPKLAIKHKKSKTTLESYPRPRLSKLSQNLRSSQKPKINLDLPLKGVRKLEVDLSSSKRGVQVRASQANESQQSLNNSVLNSTNYIVPNYFSNVIFKQ